MKVKAFIIDQDHTVTHDPPKANTTIYALAIQQAVLEQLPVEAIEHRAEVSSEAWLAQHVARWSTGVCIHTYYAEKYGLDRIKLFNHFHDCIDTENLLHDTESGAALSQIADRALILTDANDTWAAARAAKVGHNLRLLTRSCMIEQGLFDAHKADHDRPWHNALEQLRVMTGQPNLQPADIMVIDDSVKVLAKAQTLGFQVVQCLWGGMPPAPEYPQTPQVAAFLRQHGIG